jgi:hypothetical protein
MMHMMNVIARWPSPQAGLEFYRTLRDKHGFVYPQILLLMEDHVAANSAGTVPSADDIARRAKFGLIEVPDEDRARAELRRRENRRSAEKRRATMARKRREADQVTPLWSPSQGRLFS